MSEAIIPENIGKLIKSSALGIRGTLKRVFPDGGFVVEVGGITRGFPATETTHFELTEPVSR